MMLIQNQRDVLEHVPLTPSAIPTDTYMNLDDKIVERSQLKSNAVVLDRMTPLALNFIPGPFDVICARGRHAKDHCGNVRFRGVIQQSIGKYAQTDTKLEKSLIVSEIIESIRAASPTGGFVKYVKKDARWYEVGDQWAREKVGQSLRDLLHSQYKSSTKAKRIRRRRRSEELNASSRASKETLSKSQNAEVAATNTDMEEEDDIESIVRNNHYMGLIGLMKDHEEQRASDEHVLKTLVRANCDILRVLRENASRLKSP